MSTERPIRTDADLLAALGEALVTARHPQQDLVVANAQDVFTFHTLDDELATLVYDSLLDTGAATASRAVDEARVVVFENDALSIEIEIVGDTVVGQVAPPGEVTITVEAPGRHSFSVATDELGCFSIDSDVLGGLAEGPLRFQVERNARRTVTEWTYLKPAQGRPAAQNEE